MIAPLLLVEGLTVSLSGRPVLRGVDLTLRAGELVALIGPNGAGKTTLLRALAGLTPPAAGTIDLGGRPLSHLDRRDRARRIAYLAQDREIAWPITVEQVVALGRLPQGEGTADITHPAVAAALAATGTAHLARRPATELSGGERARVLLARALAGEPSLLLADEPVSGLDPRHQLEVMAALGARAAAGAAILLVLHDLAPAIQFCTRAVVVAEGRVVADGPTADVLRADVLGPVYGVAFEEGRSSDGLRTLTAVSIRG